MNTLQKHLPDTTLDVLVSGDMDVSDQLQPYSRRQLSDEGVLLSQGAYASTSASVAAGTIIDQIREGNYPAVLISTGPGISPWLAGYICYMAEIPVRVGISYEFGGGVLSHRIDPPAGVVSRHEWNMYLLEKAGIMDARQFAPEQPG